MLTLALSKLHNFSFDWWFIDRKASEHIYILSSQLYKMLCNSHVRPPIYCLQWEKSHGIRNRVNDSSISTREFLVGIHSSKRSLLLSSIRIQIENEYIGSTSGHNGTDPEKYPSCCILYAVRPTKSFWYNKSWNLNIEIRELWCERYLLRMVQAVSQWSYPMRWYYSSVFKHRSCWLWCTTRIEYRTTLVSSIRQWNSKLLWWFCTILVRRWYLRCLYWTEICYFDTSR